MSGFTYIIILFFYILGYTLSYLMLLTELKSESETITIGDRAVMVFLSFFSWLMVIYSLIMSWIDKISKTGYWEKPLKGEDNVKIVDIKDIKKPEIKKQGQYN